MSERRRAGGRGTERAGAPRSSAADHAVPPPHDPDRLAHLLISTGRGSTDAFEELFDAFASTAHGLALRIVRDPHLAEDVTQEAMVEVWRLAARFRPEQGSARAWVLTIVHRRAVDRVRSEQSHTDRLRAHGVAADPPVEDQQEVDSRLHREWQHARLRRDLGTLTDKQREALELTYYKGYTNKELADSLGIPLGTAKSRLHRAIGVLRTSMVAEEAPATDAVPEGRFA